MMAAIYNFIFGKYCHEKELEQIQEDKRKRKCARIIRKVNVKINDINKQGRKGIELSIHRKYVDEIKKYYVSMGFQVNQENVTTLIVSW